MATAVVAQVAKFVVAFVVSAGKSCHCHLQEFRIPYCEKGWTVLGLRGLVDMVDSHYPDDELHEMLHKLKKLPFEGMRIGLVLSSFGTDPDRAFDSDPFSLGYFFLLPGNVKLSHNDEANKRRVIFVAACCYLVYLHRPFYVWDVQLTVFKVQKSAGRLISNGRASEGGFVLVCLHGNKNKQTNLHNGQLELSKVDPKKIQVQED